MDSSTQSPSEPPAASSPHPPPATTVSSATTSVAAPPQSSPNANPNINPSSFQNQNPNSKASTPLPNQPSQQQQSLPTSQQVTRPSTALSGTWQPPSHFSHFSSPSPSASSGVPSPRPVAASSPAQRGGIAIGVPAHQPTPSPQPASFSASYGQHFGGLGRGGVSMSEPASNATPSQVRPPMQGMQGLGMLGSSGSSSHMPQRPVQSSLRMPSTPNSTAQNFQGHGLLRVPSASSPSSSLPNTSQGMQPSNQPWLPSTSQGKPPLPTPSYRPQANSPALQQRSHIPQQQNHPLIPASQQQQISSTPQQQPAQSHQQQEHFAQQFQPSRSSQGLPHQQQAARAQGPANPKASPLAPSQTSNTQTMSQSRAVSAETEEPCSRILSKRSIGELVNQIDPSERLDPEVEDLLVDLAEEFVESITTFGCSLAKHRKSTTLEAKDILLHLEKNWNITLPGFCSDEIKIFRKPLTNDTHRERLAAVKKSIVASEMASTRSSAGQAAGNTKSSLAKTPAV
ncbi:transcription initiation factor TFIID subunit 12 [Cucurbita pepo subsp. pepo]|uniref:transcription initiation factor TFIID subunit 12 n=1 Tax=Cucurbita pepo subsp. pepo TaxID=3664 RepID=UPI000C9D7C4E|nr:transcription initiation factor TFIID subunit 12 [Cucurbita pepo subsp. pepo]